MNGIKHIIKLSGLLLVIFAFSACDQGETIDFGSSILPRRQMRESAALARKVELTVESRSSDGRDVHYSYYFEEAQERMPFRVCAPRAWNGSDPLPLVMFLHGAWNNENSYVDQNEGQLKRLADEHGFLLVSPLGAHGAYGNNILLPAEFGREKEAAAILSNLTPEKDAANALSEKDVINVLEIVLRHYPVRQDRMFLCGHSMGGGGTWTIGGKYASYWRAIAPMSGPFVLEQGYPWQNLKKIPVYITEGTQATASLQASRKLYAFLSERGFDVSYDEYDADHGGMVPVSLPDVFRFFEQHI